MYRTTLVLTMAAACATAGAAEFHVAPNGDDAGAGTRAAPFATLSRARDAVRSTKRQAGLPAGGITVWIHGGAYEHAETFALGDQDGGAPGRPVVYRAVDGQEVRLLGGRRLSSDGLRPVTDQAALARIPESAQMHVRCLGLKSLGITEYGVFPDAFGGAASIPELFFNDKRMTLARWPNDKWATIAKVIEGGVAPGVRYKAHKPGSFEYGGDRPSRWVNAPGVWLHGYWCFDWRSETIKVASIDVEKRRIALLKIHHYGIGGGNPAPRRYHAVNLLEELDGPGEYYIDRKSGMLYFRPPGPMAGSRVVLSTLSSPVISLNGASHVTLRGLTVETCVGTGIRVTGGRENRIAACHVRNTGQDGIVVTGGQKHTVIACDIHDTGTAGLRMSGGDRKTLTSCGHQAVNNHIWRVSRRQLTGAYHVHIGGVGVRIAHNLLHHGPHQSIGLSGNDHVIELNEIHHTGMETDDCGAFYMGRNPSERGSIIRHNYWHHIGSALTHGSCAVYFDDGSGGQTVFGNVFYRAAGGSFGAVFVHGGHDNIVDNNIFVECKQAIRQASWNDKAWNKYITGELWHRKLLEEVDITKPPYIDRYPDLKGFMKKPAGRPRVNHASRNLIVNSGAQIKGNWTLTDNSVVKEDPGFVDARTLNFELRSGSRAFRDIPGFKPVPFGKMGLARDELRPEIRSGPSREPAAGRDQHSSK